MSNIDNLKVDSSKTSQCRYDSFIYCDSKCTLFKCPVVQIRDGVLSKSDTSNIDKLNKNIMDRLNDRLVTLKVGVEEVGSKENEVIKVGSVKTKAKVVNTTSKVVRSSRSKKASVVTISNDEKKFINENLGKPKEVSMGIEFSNDKTSTSIVPYTGEKFKEYLKQNP